MSRLPYLLYNLLLIALLLIGTPMLLVYMYRRQGGFEGLGERLFWPWRGRKDSAAAGERSWFHGASVGEVRMMRPLIASWRQRYPADNLLLTTMTVTGRRTAAELFPEAEIRLLPFDLPWLWRLFFRHYRPRRLIIAETELWPNLLAAAAGENLPVALVNARISEKSFRGYRRFSFFTRRMFTVPRLVVVQDEISRQRFIALGTSPDRVVFCGNMKFDLQPDPVIRERYRELFPAAVRVLVAGSTHPGEEEMILAAWEQARARVEGDDSEAVCLVLAPRHPQRFDRVADWLREKGVAFSRFSHSRQTFVEFRREALQRVLLLDTLGDLAAFYPLAAAALIGGTLVPGIGGHNPLEAAVWGRAVIHGPHTASFRDGYSFLDDEGGGLPVADANALEALLDRFFTDPEWFAAEGRKAAATMARRQGALSCTLAALERFIPPAGD